MDRGSDIRVVIERNSRCDHLGMTDNPADGPEEETGYELVMPFVVAQSAGGPFDDDALCAGFELGRLDGVLATGRPAVLTGPYKKAVLPQVDLIAMKHGYSVAVDDTRDTRGEWAIVTLSILDGGKTDT